MFEKRRQQIMSNAQEKGLIDAGETPQAVTYCTKFASPVVLSPMVTMFVGGPCAVVATDKTIYTLKMSPFSAKKPTEVLTKHEIGSVPVTKTALGLQVGSDPKVYPFLFEFAPRNEIVELAGRGGGQGAA